MTILLLQIHHQVVVLRQVPAALHGASRALHLLLWQAGALDAVLVLATHTHTHTAGINEAPVQEDPVPDRWLAPHSCGAHCDKLLGCASRTCDAEAHTCLLLCHPGPCPPCPRQVRPERMS